MPANTGEAGAIHRVAGFAGMPAQVLRRLLKLWASLNQGLRRL